IGHAVEGDLAAWTRSCIGLIAVIDCTASAGVVQTVVGTEHWTEAGSPVMRGQRVIRAERIQQHAIRAAARFDFEAVESARLDWNDDRVGGGHQWRAIVDQEVVAYVLWLQVKGGLPTDVVQRLRRHGSDSGVLWAMRIPTPHQAEPLS